MSSSLPSLQSDLASRLPWLALAAQPQITPATRVSWVNQTLAQELGLSTEELTSQEGLAWLTGQRTSPHTLAYSGYQFGNLSPLLGDGRAHLLGELQVTTESGQRKLLDLQLKGSGLTPFSRPGSDGKAPLTALWREALIGEFFAALGLKTSRVLAILETGEKIQRRGSEPEAAGILVRVLPDHLRVGTLLFAQLNQSPEERQQLLAYALERQGQEVPADPREQARLLLKLTAQGQAQLVASWMGLSFVHGVLNSDNLLLNGYALDFGPCAFIDTFRRDAVYSSIDLAGRYSYRNQPAITAWNLARCAESLLDLINPDDPQEALDYAQETLKDFETDYRQNYRQVFAKKLGITGAEKIADPLDAFIEETLDLLEQEKADFTNFFWQLSRGEASLLGEAAPGWLAQLENLRWASGTSPQVAKEMMSASNPLYIPRNLALEAALAQLAEGKSGDLLRIMGALSDPFTARLDCLDLTQGEGEACSFRSFCGT